MSSFILWFSNALDLLPLVVLLFYYRRLDSLMLFFAAFMLLTALSDALLDVLFFLKLPNNMPVIHIYLLLSVVFVGLIYYQALIGNFLKKAVIILSAVALLVMFSATFFFGSLMQYPSMSNTALSILVIIFSLLYFFQLFNEKTIIKVEQRSFFWINLGLLINFSSTILFFVLYKYLLDKKLWAYFNINDYANITFNILSTVGILQLSRKST